MASRCSPNKAATCALADDGRVVVYTGDDERQQFVYKFVGDGRFDPENPRADMDLLDRGTLYVARFEPDGSGGVCQSQVDGHFPPVYSDGADVLSIAAWHGSTDDF